MTVTLVSALPGSMVLMVLIVPARSRSTTVVMPLAYWVVLVLPLGLVVVWVRLLRSPFSSVVVIIWMLLV